MKYVFLFMALFSVVAQAQQYQFPVNASYPYGFQSSALTDVQVQADFDDWYSKYYKECGTDEARIDDNGVTVSEGIGYGMLIMAYMGKKVEFEKLWNYYKNRRNVNGFMNWQYDGCGDVTGVNGASDADLDATMALLVASKQWPEESSFTADFEELAMKFKTLIFQEYSGIYSDNKPIIYMNKGDMDKSYKCLNLSYYGPGYYRAFAKHYENKSETEIAAFWSKAADDAYFTLMRNAHPQTGLVYAWTTVWGGNVFSTCKNDSDGGGDVTSYQNDACRTPWRICIDYLWWGNPQAKIFLNRISNWIDAPKEDQGGWTGAGGISATVNGYFHDGVSYGQFPTTPFVGAFALTGMATDQKTADEYLSAFANLTGENYFNASVGLLYKLLASGNFWNPYADPNCSVPSLGNPQSLCSNPQVTLNATGIDTANDTWEWQVNAKPITHTDLTLTIDSSAYYSIVKKNGGCETYSTVFVTDEIIVPAIPVQEKLCAKNKTTLRLAGIDMNNFDIMWTYNNLPISGAYTDSLVVNQSGSYTAIISNDYCTTKKTSVYITSSLTYISGGMSVISAGESVTLKASSSAVNPVWYSDAEGSVELAQGLEYTVTPNVTTTYYLKNEASSCVLTPATVYLDTDCLDFDDDGVLDCMDLCPIDANKSEPGDCGCNSPEDCYDCDGRPFGDAFVDSCGTCAGGKTKITPVLNPSDCVVNATDVYSSPMATLNANVSSETFLLLGGTFDVEVSVYTCSNILLDHFIVNAGEEIYFGANYPISSYLVVLQKDGMIQNFKIIKQ